MSSGDSISFTICFSVNLLHLWTRLKLWLVWQLGHMVGLEISPYSMSTSAVFLQTKHWMCFRKKTLLMTISRAGMTFWG